MNGWLLVLARGDPPALMLLFPLLVIGCIATVVIIVVGIQYKKRVAALRAVAARWKGRVLDAGFFGQSYAELNIRGISTRLQFTQEGKRAFTELTIHFPDPALRLEIYPQTIFHQMRKLLGMQDIEVGVPAFDDRFIIQGNNPPLIREYLSLEVQGALQALASLTFFYNLHLNIGGGSLRITKQAHLTSEADLIRFVGLFEMLFSGLLVSREQGMEFLPTTIPSRRPDTHCQVCGEGLDGKTVYCASCQTPHHLDCWQYIGHCSVYACGQKRYRV